MAFPADVECLAPRRGTVVDASIGWKALRSRAIAREFHQNEQLELRPKDADGYALASIARG